MANSSSMMNIKKLEGTSNFDVWQTQCMNILYLKEQYVPIQEQGRKPTSMTDAE